MVLFGFINIYESVIGLSVGVFGGEVKIIFVMMQQIDVFCVIWLE